MVKLDLLDTKREEPWVYEPKISKDKKKAVISDVGCLTYYGIMDLVVLQDRLTRELYTHIQ